MKIVLDLFYSYDHSVFSSSYHTTNFGISWIPELYKIAHQQNIQLVLAKEYLELGCYSKNDLILSESYTIHTKQLLNTGATPFLIYCGESPNVAWKFYLFIKYYTRKYAYTYLFNGTSTFIRKQSHFNPFLWPNNQTLFNNLQISDSSENTNYSIVMIAGNKKQALVDGNSKMGTCIKKIIMGAITALKGPIRLTDLYNYRMKAIVHFANKPYFSLFGTNWEIHTHLTIQEKKAIVQLNPKKIEDKYKVLSKYQFALCFENCEYPGYITEKIFDCFICGCIPVYKGAPDIDRFIPSNLYIDMRKFSSFEELDLFLQNLTQEEITGYRKRISEYLKSKEFHSFTDRAFANEILGAALKTSGKACL